MNKRRRNKKRIQSMISRMLYLASALALLTFILGIVMIALKQTNNDSIARTRNFNLVESATDEMVENLSDDQITFQNIMNSYDWESVPENWIVDIYDGQDDLFFRHGDESNILATDMSVTKKIPDSDGYYIIVKLEVETAHAVLNGLPVFAGVLIFAATFLFLFRKVGKYTDEIADGIDILVAGDFDHKIPVKGNSELSVLVAGINELSDKYNENIKAKETSDKARDELITNMAHVIKTPITVIEGYLSMLLDNENLDDEKRREYTEVALNKCNELNDRANSIFEYVKLSETTSEQSFYEVSAKTYISERYEEMAMVLFSEGFECEVDITLSPMIMLKIDEAKMNRVFDNMLSNIIKYADDTEKVTLSAHVRRDYIELGMQNSTKEKLEITSEKLFERMVSGDKSRSNKSSGLGLAISKLVVEMHSGEISADINGNDIKFNILLKI